jgi:ornithine cyclodeaminase/alanine dehydrogenase-like protein (mu-crystallin family)
MQYIDADEVRALGYAAAIEAIETALREGLDPAADPPRTIIPVGADGELFTMPSAGPQGVGVKLVTRSPRNAHAQLPVIHAVYVLFDRDTLAPELLLDGTALTTLRTPAVSLAAVRPALSRFAEPPRVVIHGTGPQGVGHLDALCAVLRPAAATFVVRSDTGRSVPEPDGITVEVVRVGSPDAEDALRRADIVVCATTAREPVFDSALLGDAAVVMAVGAHDPDAREVDAGFCSRAQVVVEDVDAALREGGDVVLAIRDGALRADRLLPLRDVVTGAVSLAPDRPVLFKGSGMAWEDLVVANAVRLRSRR